MKKKGEASKLQTPFLDKRKLGKIGNTYKITFLFLLPTKIMKKKRAPSTLQTPFLVSRRKEIKKDRYDTRYNSTKSRFSCREWKRNGLSRRNVPDVHDTFVSYRKDAAIPAKSISLRPDYGTR